MAPLRDRRSDGRTSKTRNAAAELLNVGDSNAQLPITLIDNDAAAAGGGVDLCEDVEMKQRILELMSEMKTKRSSRLRLESTTSSRRNSTARRYVEAYT